MIRQNKQQSPFTEPVLIEYFVILKGSELTNVREIITSPRYNSLDKYVGIITLCSSGVDRK